MFSRVCRLSADGRAGRPQGREVRAYHQRHGASHMQSVQFQACNLRARSLRCRQMVGQHAAQNKLPQHCSKQAACAAPSPPSSHAPWAIIAAWWPCTLRVAMLPVPRFAVVVTLMSLTVTNSFPFCGQARGRSGHAKHEDRPSASAPRRHSAAAVGCPAGEAAHTGCASSPGRCRWLHPQCSPAWAQCPGWEHIVRVSLQPWCQAASMHGRQTHAVPSTQRPAAQLTLRTQQLLQSYTAMALYPLASRWLCMEAPKGTQQPSWLCVALATIHAGGWGPSKQGWGLLPWAPLRLVKPHANSRHRCQT